MTGHKRSRLTVASTIENGSLWMLGHASRVWPFVVIAVVLSLSWQAVRQIHPREFSEAIHGLDASWIVIAGIVTIVNIGAMGLYDVVAFSHTRSSWTDRWRYGAVCFAWSNFLTLGPLAGPAMRFWLYRPAVEQLSDLHGGVIAVAVAFSSGLAGWTTAALVSEWTGVGLGWLVPLAFVLSFVLVAAAQAVIRWRNGEAVRTHWGQVVALAGIGWTDWVLACAVLPA